MRAAASNSGVGRPAYPLAEAGAQILLEGDDLGAQPLGPPALQVRIAGVALGLDRGVRAQTKV
jgi:hypothetical protein